MDPQKNPHPNPQGYEYVVLHGKGDSENVIKITNGP